MVHIPRWRVLAILLITALGLAYAAPNVVPALRDLPAPLPHKTVNLGLDLRGGAYLLYEVDIDALLAERAQVLAEGARAALREADIAPQGITETERGVSIQVAPGQAGQARGALMGLENDLEAVPQDDPGRVEVRLTDAAVREATDAALARAIEIVRSRVDATGTNEAAIARQGDRRVLVQVPGRGAEEIKRLVGTTAKLGFHLVTGEGSVRALRLPHTDDPDGPPVPVERRAIITGDMLLDARGTQDPQTGEPVVSFRLNGPGATRFCQVTRAHVGEPFAIVLDGQVISAPVIRAVICEGSGVISGNFTVQGAAELALLLRSGALPAPMTVVEERSIGPTLGADSVRAGAWASGVGLALVCLFMVVAYRGLGAMAAAALLANVALIFAALSLLQATLTLPGIAGIVLTIGMAVDANVLIFERILEERRAGRSWLSAVDVGYSQAMSTITDANVTTLIAAIILFSFGTGPIKGFAVTLAIGILTSLFSAVMLTRLMVVAWARRQGRGARA